MAIECGQVCDSWVLPDKPDRELNRFLTRQRRLLNSALQNGGNYIPSIKRIHPPSKWYIQRLASEFDEFSWREIKEFSLKFKE